MIDGKIIYLDLRILLERLSRLLEYVSEIEEFPEITINLGNYKIVYGISPDYGEYLQILDEKNNLVLSFDEKDLEEWKDKW